MVFPFLTDGFWGFTERIICFSQIKILCKERRGNGTEDNNWGPFISFDTKSLICKGSTATTPPHRLQEEKWGCSGCTQPCSIPCPRQNPQKKEQSCSPSSWTASAHQRRNTYSYTTATRCNVNDYLLCNDLYQVKNHCNLNLICLYNKRFVYSELDALSQLLEISLNNKSLVRPCLTNSEKASLPRIPSLY